MSESESVSPSVVSNSLQTHGLQHAGLPCPSPPPGIAQTQVDRIGNVIQLSYPLSSPSPPALNLSQHQVLLRWVSSSHQVAKILDFQLQHQSFQWIFRTESLYDWLFRTPCSPMDSRGFSNTTVQKHRFFHTQLSLQYNSHIHTWLLEKKHRAFTRWTIVGKVMPLLFNMLSRLVIAFLPRSNCLLISWLQSPSAVILETKKIKSVTVSIVSPYTCHEVMGLDAMIFIFLNFES